MSGPPTGCRVVYSDWPRPLLAGIKADLAAVRYCLPGWLATLRLCYSTAEGEEGEIANTDARPQYREATITCRPRYAALKSEAERRLALAHELVHVSLWPYTSLVERALGRMKGPGMAALRDGLQAELALAEEGVVEDLAAALRRATDG